MSKDKSVNFKKIVDNQQKNADAFKLIFVEKPLFITESNGDKIVKDLKDYLFNVIIDIRSFTYQVPESTIVWKLLISTISQVNDYMSSSQASWSIRLKLLDVISQFMEDNVPEEEDNYMYSLLSDTDRKIPGFIYMKMLREVYIVFLVKLYTNIQLVYNMERVESMGIQGYDDSDEKGYPPHSINFNDQLDKAIVRNVPNGNNLKDFMDELLRRTTYES